MKHLLRKALKNHLPREIISRRKAGFPIPYELWLQKNLHNWVTDILLDRTTLNRGYFKKSSIEGLLNCNRDGGNYAKEVFSLVVLELWHRAFADPQMYEPNLACSPLASVEN